MNETELGRLIVTVATEVHDSLGGPGLEPVVYRNALAYALEQRGLRVETRTVAPGQYTGVKITRPERVDMVVDGQVIVVCKTDFQPRYEAQALAQLRVTGLKLALIVNFGERALRGAVRRVASGA